MKLKFEWEYLDWNTCRAKVYGGWLVSLKVDMGITITFVPDEHHRWEIDNE